MKISVFWILTTLGVLFGCSSTTIHLHADLLPEAEQEEIRRALEEQGFSVQSRDNEAPFERNIILYYPHNGIERDLRVIDDILESHGLNAEHSPAIHTNKIGTHEYTARNIGLYIAPHGLKKDPEVKSMVRSIFPMTMTDYEFISSGCEKEYVYQFFDDGTLEINDFSLAIDDEVIATMRWQDVDNVITIYNDSEQFTYKKTESHREHSSEHSRYVVTYNIMLQPIGYLRLPFGCTYKSTFFESI